MHNDEPTLFDALGRKTLIKEVGDAIAECTPPQVFGIHGDWGLGKTSFLHQVQWYVTERCPQQTQTEPVDDRSVEINNGNYADTVRAVWFDAWRYQQETAPIVALLHEMRSQLSWEHRIERSADRAREVLVRGALLSMEELTKKIGFQYSKFRDASREWEASNLAASLPSHTLRQHLREAITRLLPRCQDDAPSPRLAVFVDDIDRCEPEVAYRLLEGLKIYLTLDNCVFILGMNKKAVEDAIGSQMRTASADTWIEVIESTPRAGTPTVNISASTTADAKQAQIKSRASAYLEKICQNIWQLPVIRDPSHVLCFLLKETVGCDPTLECIRGAIKDSQCLPPNPRRLKGLANLIGRLVHLLPEASTPREIRIAEARLLVIVAYIYQFHNDLYIRWENEPDFYDEILDWCRGKKKSIPVLDALDLPNRLKEDDAAATRPRELVSNYPDPTEANVFWIQSLILKLGDEVTSQEFERYLVGGVA